MTQHYSYSALQSFKQCPLQFFYKYEVGLRLRTEGTNQHHLVYGKAMHAALEILYKYKDVPDVNHDSYLEMLAPAQGVFLANYETQLDPNDKAKTIPNGVRTLELYVKRWKAEDSRWRVINCELLDCELLPKDNDESEEDSWYRRRLDLVVEDLKYGGIYGVDHKFVGGQRTKYLNDFYWNQFDPDSQITQYTDWIKSKYGRCDGFYINAVGMNWVDEKDKGGKWNGTYFDPADAGQPWLDWSENELRYVKYYKKEMWAAWGLNVRFRREMFNRNEAQIQQERASTSQWIERIEYARQSYQVEGQSAMRAYGFNTSSCTFCEYRGNDAEPGPCKAGWTWPVDQALIELSYRRECRQIIMLACPECAGRGIEFQALDWMLAEIRSKANVGELFDVVIPPCVKCKGTGKVEGSRCVLDLDHVGECSSEMIVEVEREFEVEVPV